MSIRSKLTYYFKVKKTTSTEWVLLSAIIVMIGFKYYPTSSRVESYESFKKDGIDTRYDYVEPRTEPMTIFDY